MKTISQTRALNNLSATLGGGFNTINLLQACGVDLDYNPESILAEMNQALEDERFRQKVIMEDTEALEAQVVITREAYECEQRARQHILTALLSFDPKSREIENLTRVYEEKKSHWDKQQVILEQMFENYESRYFRRSTER